MGIWKASCSVRISAESKVALEEFAKREQRTFGNLCGILLEWGAAQLQKAGSTEQLLYRKAPIPRNPDGNYRRRTRENAEIQQGG